MKNRKLRVLITGAKGFVGTHLCARLKSMKDSDSNILGAVVKEVYEYDLDSTPEQLNEWCEKASFVFNLAGVMRPANQDEHMKQNFGFASTLLETLKQKGNACPVMLASSIQAAMVGRFGVTEYGRSKKAGEDLFFDYGKETGAKVLVYRFPNLFGEFGRPNYNSVVSTFCNNIANDLPISINDPNVELTLLYVGDLVDNLIDAMVGKETRCEFDGLTPVPIADGHYCYVAITNKINVGELAEMLKRFKDSISHGKSLVCQNGLEERMLSTFMSYLPK